MVRFLVTGATRKQGLCSLVARWLALLHALSQLHDVREALVDLHGTPLRHGQVEK